MVYVISNDSKPLMPTNRHGKVKWLLRTGKAKVVRHCPFTIQLTYSTKNYIQPITLGVDAGSKVIGISATTGKKELYAAEVTLRNDVTELISTRSEFRHARRGRTTRYRAPRFNNRVHAKHKGWLAPSIENKIHTHMQVIKTVRKILPITKLVIETAAFDIQKIKNPTISGAEYQQGDRMDFWNVREYVLFRDGHKCHGRTGCKNQILNVHHIESRKTGGDAPSNLITLCEKCHSDYHSGKLELNLKRGTSFRDATFMGVMRWTLYDRLNKIYSDVSMTYGYITKNTRISNNLEKSHCIDARCISGNPIVQPSDTLYIQRAVRKHNRQIHKATIYKGGYRKLNQAPKYVFGYQLFDKVRLPNNGGEGFIFGRRASGYFDIRTLGGEKLSAGISYKKLVLISKSSTILTERRAHSSPA
jgi:hypothetical protein